MQTGTERIGTETEIGIIGGATLAAGADRSRRRGVIRRSADTEATIGRVGATHPSGRTRREGRVIGRRGTRRSGTEGAPQIRDGRKKLWN